MSAAQPVYIGTDGGATMSKIGGVWADGGTISVRDLPGRGCVFTVDMPRAAVVSPTPS